MEIGLVDIKDRIETEDKEDPRSWLQQTYRHKECMKRDIAMS